VATGKIEEGRVIRGFCAKTGEALRQEWLVEMARRVARRLPVRLAMRMGLAALIRPRTRGWGKARVAIEEYVGAQQAKQRRALGLPDLVEIATADAANAASAIAKH